MTREHIEVTACVVQPIWIEWCRISLLLLGCPANADGGFGEARRSARLYGV